MKNSRFFQAFVAIFLFSASFLTGPVVAQNDNPVVTALQPRFGQVMISDLEKQQEFTLSLPFNEIETALNLIIAQEWYPTWVSISARPDEKAALILRAAPGKNESAKRFTLLQQLVSPGMLPWKTAELNNQAPGVTAVETDFSEKVVIMGETLKSGLIFTHLFPMIERVPGITAPFFERGSYSDTAAGRVMNFTVKCNW